MPDPDLPCLIADLRESARWPRTHPDEAARMAEAILYAIDCAGIPYGHDRRTLGPRLHDNISVSIRVVRSNPDMLAAYLRAAADEIEAFVDQRREKEGPDG